MSAFTRLGSALWDWEPFTQLADGAQILWLALYTSAEAKRIVPGLWHGSITTMAEAARKPVDETRSNLDKLLEADMVEFDVKLRVLRLTMLPDAGESPANPNVLRGWFRKFSTVPACAVRDAHVPVIRWLMDQWARDNGKAITPGHEQAWVETFGRIAVPAPRKRGVRRLAESDTSTPSQPSLFRPQTVPVIGPSVTCTPADARSVDNSASLRQMNDSGHSETVTQTVSKPSGEGSGIGSGSGSPESEKGGAGGTVLALVQPPRGELDDLLQLVGEIAGGTWNVAHLTPERVSLQDQIGKLGGLDLSLLGSWWRATGLSVGGARDVLTVPGRLIAACQEAERWRSTRDDADRRAREMSKALREDLAKVGLGAYAP